MLVIMILKPIKLISDTILTATLFQLLPQP